MFAALRELRHGPLRGLSPLWTGLGRAYRRVLEVAPFRFSVPTRIGPYGPFRLDARFAFSDYRSWGRGRNAGFAVCIDACAGAKCVIDVGAHIGLVALPMSRAVAPGGRVIAFEPAAFNRALLNRHVALNHADNIEVFDDLVGDVDGGTVTFYETDTDSGLNSVLDRPNKQGFRQTSHKCVSLDGFCTRQNLRPQVIKIDVEGAEVGVLRGARAVLREARPVVILSVHPAELKLLGHDVAELSRLIDELEYECRDVQGQAVAELAASEYVLWPRGVAV